MRLWERIYKDLQDFGRGFARIGEDSQDWERIHKDSHGFVRLWESICKDL